MPPRAALPAGAQSQLPVVPASPIGPLPASAPAPPPRPAFMPELACPPPEDAFGDLASAVGDVYWDANQTGAMLQVSVYYG